jgi:WD40 repeat protein
MSMAYNSKTFTIKQNLLKLLNHRNKTETDSFEDIIKHYNDLLCKYWKQNKEVERLCREMNSVIRISGDPTVTNELQSKVYTLEKELTETIKENNSTSNKLCEILTDKIRMKDEIDTLTKQNNTRHARILELEEIVNNQDREISKLKEDIRFLKSENAKLEKQNISMNENLNKKVVENNNLINEILNIKNDYMTKMNEMLELVDSAKMKKEAAEIYFQEMKRDSHKKSGDINLLDSVKEFQIQLEDVQIPNKLKIKLSAHKKNITSLKFNNFGTNFITTGVDAFVKLWDASRSKIKF